jgi:hypothetical protein
MAVNVDHPPQPEVAGLTTEGSMGKEPAMTISTIMAIVGGAVAAGSQLLGYELPPDVRQFGNDWGAALAGAAVAAWALLQGRIIRNNVVSPATALNLVRRAARR